MGVIPFITSYDEDYNTVYNFRYKPDTISKEGPYEVKIVIDELNDSLVISKSCTCKGNWQFKMECKHLKQSFEILKEYGIQTREDKQEESLAG